MIIISEKVTFYISGDVVRDIGIVYFSEILKEIGIDYELTRNYLKFDYTDSKIISNYIIDNKIFQVFVNGNLREFKDSIPDFDKLNCNNILEHIAASNLKTKDKEKIEKAFHNRRFPYIRNSPIYGGNTNFDDMHSNFEKLVDIVVNNNISVNKKNLDDFKETDIQCSICGINHTTNLGINLKERKDSKYLFLFRGPEESGFKNNGNSQINICFECEFLNLMTLLYINLERPVTLAYVNNLRELLFINYKIMLRKRLYSVSASEKGVFKEKKN